MTRHGQGAREDPGMLEILDGPCCDEWTCQTRELWPYQSETHEQMIARLKAKYNWHAMDQETQP